MDNPISTYTIDELKEGQEATLNITLTEQALNAYRDVSGDINPLHQNADFAKDKGFTNIVVHGGLLISYLSQLAGVHLPGQNCLIQNMRINFTGPAYIGDELKIHGCIDQISLSTKTIILRVTITNHKSNETLLKGALQIGMLA